MYLIVGLGNPGKEYELSRHNLGFRVIDSISKDLGIDVSKFNSGALIGQGDLDGTRIMLAKPQTFMNLSGICVRDLMNWYKIEKNKLIVINDDLDLDPGRIKIMDGGNSAGHKGVESVIAGLGTTRFARIRVGIGRESLGGDNSGYVLQKPDTEQMEAVDSSIIKAADAAKAIITKGIEAARNLYNGT